MAQMTISGQTFEVPDEAFGKETEMGPNPYFPDATAPAAAVSADETTGAENAQQAVGEEEGSPDPTFDIEADRAAGIDVDSPMYKRFQEVAARKAPTTPERNLAAELDELKARNAQSEIERDTTPAGDAPESLAYKVDWNDFTVAKAAEDSPIHGIEDEISKQIRQHVEYAIGRVNKQTEEYTQQVKLTQTRDYLTQVVEEIGNAGGPGKKQEALTLLKEYLPIAKSDPVKWARFAVASLGIPVGKAPAQAPASAPQGDPQKVARQVRSATTRPTMPGGAMPPKKPEFKGPQATRDAIAWAMDHPNG